MKQKLLNSIRLRAMMLVAVMCAAFAGQAWGDETITWAINGVNTTASGGTNVNTTLRTSSITGGSGTWTAVASSSYAGSSTGAQFGSSSYTFAGTLTLSASSIPSTATIKSIGITLSSSGTAYTIAATVGGNTFGSSVAVDQKASKTYSFSGTETGNAIQLTFANGGKKNVIITSITVTYAAAPATPATVTFSDGGSLTEASAGAGVTLPSRAAVGDYTFAGWAVASCGNVETTTAPEDIFEAGDTYKPEGDITLYPVYTRVVSGGAPTNQTSSVNIATYANDHSWSNATKYTSITIDENVTATAVGGGNTGKYYSSSGGSWRIYSSESGKFTISTSKGTLTSATITFSNGTLSYGGDDLTSGDAVELSGTSADFVAGGTTYISAISVTYTYTPAGTTYYISVPVAAAVATPVITIAANPFLFSTTATIDCDTDGATIYYTTNGDVPTDESTEYTAAIPLTATTTIKAIAIKNSEESLVATAIATKNLAEPTVAVSGDLVVDLNGDTNVSAGTLSASVTYNEAAVEGAVVEWSSSNNAIATIDANTGAVTLLATGTVTFTATYAGNSDYAEATDTKVITVTDTKAPGASGNPYTVAQAIAATPASGTSANVYIRGIVSQFYNTSIVGDGANYRYYISDDGTTATQLLVYKGKKNSTDDFSSADDLLVGDVVTIVGGLTTYNSTKEVAAGNYIVSRVTKEASDLTLTSDVEVELERTSANANPTSDITWETSSTGTITCESSNIAVATVTNAGVITAVGEGSAIITISQVADATYKAGQTTVTVNVTDNRSAVATGIDLPVAQKTLTVGDMDDFAATCTKDAGFTGSITYTYATSDASIVDVDETTFSAEAPGNANITITATPTGGNAENYKAASQVVAVTVNGTNSISLDPTSKTQAYSAGAFAITATVPTANYDGAVTAESNNTAVATVSVDGTTVTVTPVAVGTATITVTAGAGTYYPATAAETCEVTVTAPAGSKTAPSSEVTYTFDFTDNTVWGFPTDYTTGENTYTKDGKTVTLNTPDDSNGYKFNTNVLLFGKTDATLTLPAFDKPVTQITTEGKAMSSAKVKFNIYVDDEAVSTEVTSSLEDHEFDIDSEYQDAGTIYTLKVTNGNNVQIPTLTVHMYQAPTATVTLNASGYGTFCSVNPMDFSETDGYTAWRISSIDMDGTTGTVTCNKITEAIKGGQGVLLYNKDADGKNTTNVTVTFANGTTEFTPSENLLIGTTAPTYVASNEYFGLSGSNFVKVNAGVVPAGKALLDADDIPAFGSVKSFIFVFNDDATGITETRTATREEVEAIFNLGGQRMSKMQRGVNIVNGKKVLVK